MVKARNIKNGFLILAWGLYDLANQFFILNIVSLYFVRWLTLEKGAPEILYSLAFSISAFLIAISAPILGVVSDMLNRRMPFLIYLTLLSVAFTMILGVSENVFLALLFFAVANFGCQTAVVFYNALLTDIAPKGKIGLVSGFGRMLGYSGALLALYLIKPIVLKSGYRATFLPTGILFLIFALPCLIFIKDRNPLEATRINLLSFLKKEKVMAFNSHPSPAISNFLKASFFGLCAVNVIIVFMSVYATRVFKLSEAQVINLITFSTFFAIIGSIASGYICDRIGTRTSLIATFILWGICLMLGGFVRGMIFYWLVGSLVGITLGATWVVCRAMAVQLAPAQRIGEIFGLFNLVGYLSGIMGTLFWGVILLFLSPLGEPGYRLALLSLNLFVLLGFIFLLRTPPLPPKFSL